MWPAARQTSIFGLDHRNDLPHTDRCSECMFDELRGAPIDTLEAKVDRHFGAVTGFAGGVNTSRHMAHLCHWLDQTRQQTRIGNAGHVEKSAIGSGATERRLRL